ncbi:MAG: hypothetical protein CM15mP122_1980 [Bacteroidota bacterium]|nr:MAG: hypothetical protein CM15mP122_1980 [Bacteroidota bacterium]
MDLSSYSAVTVQINFKSENTNSTEATYEHSTNWNTQTGGFGLFAHSAGGPFVIIRTIPIKTVASVVTVAEIISLILILIGTYIQIFTVWSMMQPEGFHMLMIL